MLVALENGLFVFVEGKLEKPEKNPQSTAKTNNKLNPRVWAGIESRPHWWRGSTLITAPWQLASRPFPIFLVPLFQSESKRETIHMKVTLIYTKMKLHAEFIFHLNGFALRLVLIQRQKVNRNWPIQKALRRRKTLRGLLRANPHKNQTKSNFFGKT